jgi:hypothetical protein
MQGYLPPRQPVLVNTGSQETESQLDLSSDKRASGFAVLSAHMPSGQSCSLTGGTYYSSVDWVHNAREGERNSREELESALDQLHDNHERFADRFFVLNHFFRRTGGQGVVQVRGLLRVESLGLGSDAERPKKNAELCGTLAPVNIRALGGFLGCAWPWVCPSQKVVKAFESLPVLRYLLHKCLTQTTSCRVLTVALQQAIGLGGL